jgi:hypothetical protein
MSLDACNVFGCPAPAVQVIDRRPLCWEHAAAPSNEIRDLRRRCDELSRELEFVKALLTSVFPDAAAKLSASVVKSD